MSDRSREYYMSIPRIRIGKEAKNVKSDYNVTRRSFLFHIT